MLSPSLSCLEDSTNVVPIEVNSSKLQPLRQLGEITGASFSLIITVKGTSTVSFLPSTLSFRS